MDDATALRLKKIEILLHDAERGAEMQIQRRIAVLVVCATVGASAALAGAGGQLPPVPALLTVVLSAVLIALQFRGLRLLAAEMRRATAAATAAIDSLITNGGE